jgi:primosomal protein N' (replication factor Y) (superfamily II helicase)
VEPGEGPAHIRILRIALALPFSHLYDYLPPADCPSERLVPGHRVCVPFKAGARIGFLIEVSDESAIAPEKLRRAIEVLDQAPIIHAPQLGLLIWASDYYHHPLGEVVAHGLPGSLRRVRAIAPRIRDAPGPSRPPAPPPAAPVLTTSQADAIQHITTRLDRFEVFLLEGVTGSGKTEVYLRIVEAVIERGKQALCLVPEIGLTPQTIARFQERFAVPIAATHSGLSETQRRAAWWTAREGLAPIVIGTRSAVWSELCRPGVIVVDEEHDLSYKQQQGFRYSARDVAMVRAKRHRIPVVLGSATPSLESLHNAAIGRYRHLRLPARVGCARDPTVEVIDLRRGTARGPLSAALIARITETLAERRQVILFANRRGYAPLLLCPECAWAAGCDRCDARLVYHHETRRLRCHHCGADRPVPMGCPECGSAFLCKVGHGTERVVESLREHFPAARILRLDRDAVRGQAAWERVLARIAEGDADILVGTQMLTKGHHFPKVTLVAIVDGDQGLYGTDFRAGERMAQQLVQVAGRTGRAEDPGQVVIQTHNPHHPLLAVLLREGYSVFAAMALQERREARLPPFSALALVRAEGRDSRAPEAFLDEARALGLREGHQGTALLGPVPAPMERRADRYRWHLLVQARERKPLQTFLRAWLPQLAALKSSRRVRWSVDVDPQELL